MSRSWRTALGWVAFAIGLALVALQTPGFVAALASALDAPTYSGFLLLRFGPPAFFYLALGYLALAAPSIRLRVTGMAFTLAITFFIFQRLVWMTTPMFDVALR